MADLRPIGSSGLLTPPLVLGGNVFGWTTDRDQSFAVLDAFVSGGGRMVDTADVYSAWVDGNKGGESETIVGEWLRRRGRRDDVLLATKAGLLPIDGGKGLAPDHLARAIDASLARLGTDRVDLWYAHRDDPEQPLDAVAAAFDAAVSAGKVRAVAGSNYSAERLAEMLDAQEKAGGARFCALQNQLNLLERDDAGEPIERLCVDREVAGLPYYGLASGYLTGKYRTPDDLRGKPRDAKARQYMDGNGPRVLTAMDAVAEETGATLAQIALAWVAAQPGVAAPIASATSPAQVDELLGATELRLSADQLKRLSAAGAPADAAA